MPYLPTAPTGRSPHKLLARLTAFATLAGVFVMAYSAALAAYDALVARFQAPDGGGASIIRQAALLGALSAPDTVLVMMKLNKVGGSRYTQKNLRTSFGAMPFKVAAQTIDIHGGYANANKIGDLFPSDGSQPK